MSTVEEIKNRANIVDVISQVVPLKKAGSTYKGLCPFHGEKTPSFVVSEDKQFYNCFGCGASGDVIAFIKNYYNLDFIESVEKLADMVGTTFDRGYEPDGRREHYYEINKNAAKFFYKEMRKGVNKAVEYMTKRGISVETLNLFGIGYADDSWDSLTTYLTNLGYEKKELLEIGLISQSNGKYYDKYRNRVMFPIINTRGKIIGFGGRVLGDGNPKYLNSQESLVFQKKNNLFGLNITSKEMGKENQGILVEGYMDVIALYEGGVKNTTASLGTALTENQGKILKRYSPNVVISYDGDRAGKSAALRGMDILHKQGCKVKVIPLPAGQDPDDYIKKHGKGKYLELVEEALPFADYKFLHLKEEYGLNTTEGRIEFLTGAVKVLQQLTPVEADLHIKKLSKEYNISEGALRKQLSENQRKAQGTVEPQMFQQKSTQNQEKKRDWRVSLLEKNLIKVLLTDGKFFEKDIQLEDFFTTEEGHLLYMRMKENYIVGEEIDQNKLMDSLEEQDQKVLRDIQENIRLGGKIEQIFEDCIKKIMLKKLKEQEKWINMKLSIADEEENEDEIRKLMSELMDIQNKIRLGG